MRINEFAASQGITNNALYKAIKRTGHSTKELTDKRGNITAAGFTILRRIYQEEETEAEAEKRNTDNELIQEKINDLKIRLEAAEKRARDEAERAEKWEGLYIELQEQAAKERAETAKQLQAAQVLLSQQQEINRQLMVNPIRRLFLGRGQDKTNRRDKDGK